MEDGNSQTLYIGTVEGVYALYNEGQTLENVTNELDSLYITSLMLTETEIYMGTNNNGVWMADLPVDITEDINKHPEQFMLLQNYPNPFNPTTTIEYSLPAFSELADSEPVLLKIYDVLGGEVATLVSEHQRPGNYKVTFDAATLASGVYYYRLTAGDPSTGSGRGFVESKKMLLLK